MATVACPGCGLPRVESELGAKPCPVCAAAPTAAAPRARKPAAPDPTAGLPADASQLHTADATRPPDGGSRLTVGAVAFACGLLCGVGGVFAVQELDSPKSDDTEPKFVSGTNAVPPPQPQTDGTGGPRPPLAEVQVAPMPRAVVARPPATEPDPDPEPKAQQPPPPPGRVTTFELNQPDAPFVVPFTMKAGQHVVLKGKAKSLRVAQLDGGAILDASQLEVGSVAVNGVISGGSKLKVKAPAVSVFGRITGGAEVTIDAAGGEVKFNYPTTPARDGSKIDGGAKVAITARVVEFKGDIAGDGTKVSVVLTRNAWLKFAALSDKATLEYKSQVAGWSPPDVLPGTVAPGATFQKIDNDR